MKFLACLIAGIALVTVPSITCAQINAPAVSAEDKAAAEKYFKAGNNLMAKHNYSEALAQYKEALAKLPDNPSLLWNTALAAYFSKDYALAAGLWEREKKLEPEKWHIRAKLIQVYQGMGNIAARDAERSALYDLRKKGMLESLSKEKRYSREQFEVNGRRVLVFEYFELEGKRAVRYAFIVFKPNEEVEEFRISLGSYEDTNKVSAELGELKPGERLFHLDGYFKDGVHATYGFYKAEPTYDETRKKVLPIIETRTK